MSKSDFTNPPERETPAKGSAEDASMPTSDEVERLLQEILLRPSEERGKAMDECAMAIILRLGAASSCHCESMRELLYSVAMVAVSLTVE